MRDSSRAMVAQSPLRLYLLGSFRVERDARTIRLPTRKVESLLAFLILHPEEHAREKLAALFWGDSSDLHARHSLRTALNVIRKQLGNAIFLGDYEVVQLNPDFPIWVDAREFAEIGDWRLEIGNSETISNLQSLISLYSGDLLADFYDDWILPERERLRGLYHNALLRLAQAARARSEYARAIEYAQKVLASDPAHERAHQQLMFCFAASGQRDAALKQYAECQRVLREELAVEPARETTALYLWLLQSPAPSREAMLTNLPIPLTSFIGREQAMEEIKRLLARTRWITLTGAGGSGKTRLALQVATDLVDAFKDGVWWVELAPLRDEMLVPNVIAKAVGVRESPSEPLSETIASYLRSRNSLLVLDNCEHVLAASAQLATTLLSAAANLKILATSREAHGVFGETVWNVPTLAVPNAMQLPPLVDLTHYESVRLLIERAAAVKTDFALTPQNANAVAQICERLDGIPLAIELAAARVKSLPIEQIAARLDDRFGLLTVGSRTALPRHRTLRAMIDWGYELLTEDERALLRRLSVFAGGWTLEGAHALYGAENVSKHDVLDLLTRLVTKSLVVACEWKGEARYRFLESLRQYGAAHLAEGGEMGAARHRHAIFFAEMVETAEQGLRGKEMRAWIERIEIEHDNFRAALAWSLEHESPEFGLRFADALGHFWSHHGYIAEGRKWLERLIARGAELPAHFRAKALMRLGWIAFVEGDYPQARHLDETSLTLFRAVDDKIGMADALNQMGLMAMYENDTRRASAYYAESLTLCDQAGYRLGRAVPLIGEAGRLLFQNKWSPHAKAICEEGIELCREMDDQSEQNRGHVYLALGAHFEGDDERAVRHLEKSVALGREAKDKRRLCWALLLLGLAMSWVNRIEEGLARGQEGMRLAREIMDKTAIANGLQFFMQLSVAQNRMERAARLIGADAALRESLGFQLAPMMHAINAPLLAAIHAALDDARYDFVFAEGRAMSLERAIAYALEEQSET